MESPDTDTIETGGDNALRNGIVAAGLFLLGLLLWQHQAVVDGALKGYAAVDTWWENWEGPPPATGDAPATVASPTVASPAVASPTAQRVPQASDAMPTAQSVSPSRAPVVAGSQSPDKPAATSPPPPAPLARLYAAPAAPPAVPDGRAGLVQLLRGGALRPASGTDVARWRMRHNQASLRPAGPDFEARLRDFPAYLVTGDMQFPSGLHGAHAVVFILDDKAPYPAGDPGHSALLDVGSGSCMGALCGFLLQ